MCSWKIPLEKLEKKIPLTVTMSPFFCKRLGSYTQKICFLLIWGSTPPFSALCYKAVSLLSFTSTSSIQKYTLPLSLSRGSHIWIYLIKTEKIGLQDLKHNLRWICRHERDLGSSYKATHPCPENPADILKFIHIRIYISFPGRYF